jgi:hypothetical protein
VDSALAVIVKKRTVLLVCFVIEGRFALSLVEQGANLVF